MSPITPAGNYALHTLFQTLLKSKGRIVYNKLSDSSWLNKLPIHTIGPAYVSNILVIDNSYTKEGFSSKLPI